MRPYIFICCLTVVSGLWGQKKEPEALPYAEIPDYPEAYTAETVAARMIDGLGFRYYWATEGLTPADLAYKPGKEARTSAETIDHIYMLCRIVAHTVAGKPNEAIEEKQLSFEEKRGQTLWFLKQAADKLRTAKAGTLKDVRIIFKRGEDTSEFPFWNLINGPIADALWHVGQVVSFRRASGNPLNPKVSVFNGKLRD